jgi:hypothetical protein
VSLLVTNRIVAAATLLLFMAACQVPGSGRGCNNVMIDWVNFIQVGQTQYVAGPASIEVVQESDLGPVYTQVKFKVSGNVCDPNYRPKDGDAAFLDPGSPIYQVKGFAVSERLAARFNDQIVVYKAAAASPTLISQRAPPRLLLSTSD